MIGRAKSRFEEEPARANEEFIEQVELAVQADRLLAMKLEIDFQMVL